MLWCFVHVTGYMNGAVDAGERAARQVLHAMERISEDMIYQEEPPSEDVPPVPCGLTGWKLWVPSVPMLLVLTSALGLASGVGVAIAYKKL